MAKCICGTPIDVWELLASGYKNGDTVTCDDCGATYTVKEHSVVWLEDANGDKLEE